METIHIDDVDNRVSSASVQRSLTDPLGTENLALNYYELAPGESFAYGYHSHEAQEEVFVVQEGCVTFETEDGEVSVAAGDAIRFAPGEFQQGINEGAERVVAFAIGAPRESGELRLFRTCESCGERTPATIERADNGGTRVTVCLECGAETGRYE